MIYGNFYFYRREDVTSFSVCNFSYFSVVPLYIERKVGEGMGKILMFIYLLLILVLSCAVGFVGFAVSRLCLYQM